MFIHVRSRRSRSGPISTYVRAGLYWIISLTVEIMENWMVDVVSFLVACRLDSYSTLR